MLLSMVDEMLTEELQNEGYEIKQIVLKRDKWHKLLKK